MAHERAIIFIGGDAPSFPLVEPLLHDALIVAADSGWAHAIAAGVQPRLLVGDMDSIDPEHLLHARTTATAIVEHPVDKDMTDLEIALVEARRAGARRIHVVAGGGDRFDHVLAMVHSLVSVADDAEVSAQVGTSWIDVLTPRLHLTLDVEPGATVSLVPLGGHAKGVTTRGLKWELDRDVLRSFASRGVSNVALEARVRVSVRTGVIAVIRPLDKENTK